MWLPIITCNSVIYFLVFNIEDNIYQRVHTDMHTHSLWLDSINTSYYTSSQTNYVEKITSKVQVNLLYMLLLYMTNYVPLFINLVSYRFGAGDTIEYNRNYKCICHDLFIHIFLFMYA